jgi:hypothetical protein
VTYLLAYLTGALACYALLVRYCDWFAAGCRTRSDEYLAFSYASVLWPLTAVAVGYLSIRGVVYRRRLERMTVDAINAALNDKSTRVLRRGEARPLTGLGASATTRTTSEGRADR